MSIVAPLLASRRYSASLSLGVERASARGNGNAGISIAYRPNNLDVLTLSATSNHHAMQSSSLSSIGALSLPVFNCDAHNAVGSGPQFASDSTRSSQMGVSWTHRDIRISTSISINHQVVTDAALRGTVGAAALDPHLFTPAYLAEVAAGAAQACGLTSPFTLSDLYYDIEGIAPRAIFNTAQASLTANVGGNVATRLTYSLTSARAFGPGGLLFAPSSTIISGHQLPHVPYGVGNLEVAAVLGRNLATALLNLSYVTGNNFNNVPAFLTLDAGLTLPLRRGEITLSGLNLTAEHPGPFATDDGAVALPTGNGSYATIAQPQQPRTFAIAYRIPLGTTTGLPTSGGGVAQSILPFAVAGPNDPLAINRSSPLCGPEMVPSASGFDDAMRRYIKDIISARSPAGYPATFPSSDYAGVRLLYRTNGTSYVVIISEVPAKDAAEYRSYRSLLRNVEFCSFTHRGSLAEARAAGLYVSPHNERVTLRVMGAFAPQVGLYFMPPLIEDPSPSYLPMPAIAPSNAFEIHSSPACPDRTLHVAKTIVAMWQTYISLSKSSRATPAPLDQFRITTHDSAGGQWLEITDNEGLVNAIAPCLAIHGVKPADLATLGLDGTWDESSVEYTPRLGFYRLVP